MKRFDKIEIERLGGLAGFGLPGSRLRSRGTVSGAQLSAEDVRQLDALFDDGSLVGDRSPTKAMPAEAVPIDAMPDAFRYRLICHAGGETKRIVVSETRVPDALLETLRDELA